MHPAGASGLGPGCLAGGMRKKGVLEGNVRRLLPQGLRRDCMWEEGEGAGRMRPWIPDFPPTRQMWRPCHMIERSRAGCREDLNCYVGGDEEPRNEHVGVPPGSRSVLECLRGLGCRAKGRWLPTGQHPKRWSLSMKADPVSLGARAQVRLSREIKEASPRVEPGDASRGCFYVLPGRDCSCVTVKVAAGQTGRSAGGIGSGQHRS